MTTQKQLNAAAIHPITALDAQELVPDHRLRALATGGAERDLGEISKEEQRVLSMYLPDICGELLAFRLAHRLAEQSVPFPQPHPLTERLRAVTKRFRRLVTA